MSEKYLPAVQSVHPWSAMKVDETLARVPLLAQTVDAGLHVSVEVTFALLPVLKYPAAQGVQTRSLVLVAILAV